MLLCSSESKIIHRNRLGQTPLHIAANQGGTGLVEILVKQGDYGAEINSVDNNGDTRDRGVWGAGGAGGARAPPNCF